MKRFWITVVLIAVSGCVARGQDVVLLMNTCYNVGDTMTLEAQYSGSRTAENSLWYITGGSENGFTLIGETCSTFGVPDAAFPTSRMTYECPETVGARIFRVKVAHLVLSDFEKTWGAKILLTAGSGTTISGTQYNTVNRCVPISEVTMTSPSSGVDNTVDIIQDTPVEFVCKTTAGLPQATITWFWKLVSGITEVIITGNTTEPITDADSLITVTGRLTIRPTISDQGRMIYCSASNTVTNIHTAIMQPTLNVLYAPVVQPLPYQNIVQFSSFSKLCQVKPGNPGLTTYRWTRSKDGLTQTTATLTINSVTKTDADTYTCRAKNTMSPTGGSSVNGKDEKSFILGVLYAPVVQPHPDHNMLEFASLSKMCQVTLGNPALTTYRWARSKDGLTQTTATLSINNVTRSDADTYTCRAQNTMSPTGGSSVTGTDEKSFILDVLYAPLVHTLSNHNMLEFSSLYKMCQVTPGNPALTTYKWSRSKDGPTQTTATLSISNVTRSDSDRYTCTAQNTMSPTGGSSVTGTDETSFILGVLYAPVVQPLPDHNILEFSNLSKSCQVIPGNPALTTSRWTRSKGGLTQTSSTLTINNVTRSDADTYTCRAQNTMSPTGGSSVTGTDEKSFILGVLYATVVQPLPDHTILEFSRLSNLCQVTSGNPALTTYRWTRRKDGLTQTSATLIINNVTRSDADTYTCRAQNTMSPTGGSNVTGSDEKSFILDVLYPAAITSFKEIYHTETTVTVSENASVSFQCLVESNPGSTIRINKGVELKVTKLNTNQAEYSIALVRCSDAGLYTCIGFNDHNGNEHPSKHVLLYVLCSPRLSVNVDLNITKAQHENATLSVTVEAYPEPSRYVWARLNESTWADLTPSSVIQISYEGLQSNLTISDVKQSDYGQYRVSVTNTVGVFQQLFSIIAQDKPDPPSFLRHISESITETSATIAWNAGFDGGPPQTFYLQYRAMSATSWFTETRKHQSEATLNITLNGLMAETTYEVQVYARNIIGNSSTAQISFMTKDSADPAHKKTVSGAVIGGVVGGLIVTAVIVLVVILARKYEFKISCEFKKKADNPDSATPRVDRTYTEANTNISDPASYYNTINLSDSSHYCSLTGRDSSVDAYDTVHNTELEELPSSKIYENLKI